MFTLKPVRNRFLNQIFSDAHPVVKLFFVFFIILTSLLIFSFIGILLAMPIFHIPINNIENLLNGNLYQTNIPLLKYIQITQSIAVFVIPAIFLRSVFLTENTRFLFVKGFNFWLIILLILIVMVFSIPLIEQLIKWNHALRFPPSMSGMEEKIIQMEESAAKLTEKLLSVNSWGDLLLNVFMIAIIPAIGEEFLFRDILQKIFYDWTKNDHWAILISAIIFSTVHMQFYGFFPRMLLGVLFGYIVFWGRNIWFAVAAHFFNNVIAVVFNFLETTNRPYIPDLLDNKSFTNPSQLILSMIIVSIGIFYIRKKCRVKI
jgi:membrane protease YdiL (CAAX protease family)